MARAQIKKLSWWHESLMEWMLLNPDRPLREAAIYFSVSQAWLSTVIHSDAFQAVFEQRRNEHAVRVSASIIQKAETIAHLALDEVTEQLEKGEIVAPKPLLATAEMALKTLGYSARSDAPIPNVLNQQNNTFVVAKEDLERARERMALTAPPKVIEHAKVVTEPTSPPRDGDGAVLPAAVPVSASR